MLISAAFWLLPSWVIARSFAALRGSRPRAAWLTIALLASLWVLPFATFCFGGQILYHRVFHSYMGRDTLRLGIALRGTVGDWFSGWGGPWLMTAMLLAGVLVTAGVLWVGRKAPSLAGPLPIVPHLSVLGALFCFWTDNVDSGFLQAALPDTCFVHGVVHAVRMAVTGQWHRRQGVSMRTPAPLPALASIRPRPQMCSSVSPGIRADASCADRRLDARARSSTTWSPIRLRWATSLPERRTPSARRSGSGPDCLEYRLRRGALGAGAVGARRAVGYRGTCHLGAPEYESFGIFHAPSGYRRDRDGLDLGACSRKNARRARRACGRCRSALRTVRPSGHAVLRGASPVEHARALSRRTRSLCRNRAAQSADPLGNVQAFQNRYRDSVRMQERTLAVLLRELRALPTWSDTAVVFVSDHGEQFREHGGLYHNVFLVRRRGPDPRIGSPRAIT